MKRKVKMFVVDVVILLICAGIFVIFKLTGIISIVITIIAAVVFHTLLSYNFTKKEIIEEEEKKVNVREQIERIRDEYPLFSQKINKFEWLVAEFESRQKALKKLIELNKGEKATYLLERSKEAEQFLLQECNQFEKCLVVLQVLRIKEEEYQKTEEELDETIKTVDELVNVYSELLSEVIRMGNKLNLDDPGLTSAVEKLKSIRNETNESAKKGLFVVSSKEKDLNE